MRFREGDEVEARFRGRSKWFKGRIVRENHDGTYAVDYADGDREPSVESHLIRRVDDGATEMAPRDAAFREGDKVEARYRGRSKYFPGVISRVNRDGTFDIDYDDGEQERGVEANLIRKSGGGDTPRDLLREGDKVEARYRGRSKYFPGVITRVNRDGTFDIDYDDGEQERGVEANLIRRLHPAESNGSARQDFREGDKVEARYRGRSRYYPGVISRANRDGTFDVDYDDGEKERGVEAGLIRSLGGGGGGESKQEPREGDKVEARYRGRSRYYPGTVARVNRDGTFDIDYDDGEKERGVELRLIRSLEDPQRLDQPGTFREGDKVEARYRGRSRYCPGVISRVNRDDTYDIDYDDGEKERGVEIRFIRHLAPEHTADDKQADYREGDKVEARYRGRSKYFPGVISRVNRDGTFDIDYDDGEQERGVEANLIRKLGGGDMPRDLLREGDKVEARYRGRSKYFPGVISRVNRDGTFDIDYDDGKQERGIEAELVRTAIAPDGHLFRAGDKVKARLSPTARDFFKGVIARVNRDGTYDIDNDESGRQERDIAPRLVERLKSWDGEPPRKFRDGDKVEARLRGRSRYYPGVIVGVNRDGTFDVNYDDGERERDVEADLIRFLASKISQVSEYTLIARSLREQLFVWAKSNRKSALSKVFKALDKTNTGVISRSDMAACLSKKMKLSIDDRDLDVLMDCIDFSGTGKIDYDEFLDFAYHQPEGEEIGVIHDLITSEVRQAGVDILSELKRYDSRGRNTIKASDLRKVMQRIGVELKDGDFDELLRRFGFNGEIEYDQFAMWVNSGSDLHRVERRVRRSLQRLMRSEHDLRSIFRQLDQDQSGDISQREFQEALECLGLMITEGEVRALVSKYDRRGRGIRYEEFLVLAQDSVDDLHDICLLSDSTAESLEKWVSEHSSSTLRCAFCKLDKDGHGWVSFRGLDKVTSKFRGLKLEKEGAKELRTAFQTGNGDNVNFHRLLDFASGVQDDRDLVELHTVVSEHMHRESVDLIKEFSHYDPDSKLAVSSRNFQRVLSKDSVFGLRNRDSETLSDSFRKGSEVDYLHFAHWAHSGTRKGRVATEKALSLCLKIMIDEGKDYMRLFRALDPESTGKLLVRDFRKAVRHLGFPLEDHEVRILAEEHETQGREGLVNYLTLLDSVSDVNSLLDAEGASRKHGTKGKGGGMGGENDMYEGLASWYRDNGTALMRKTAKREERSKRGTMSTDTFRRQVLPKVKLRLRAATVDFLLKCFELEEEGSLHHRELFCFCRALTRSTPQKLWPLHASLREAVLRTWGERSADRALLGAFRKMEGGQTGRVPSASFRQVLIEEAKVEARNSELRDVADHFDEQGKDEVDYEAFLEWLCVGKRLSKLRQRVARALQASKQAGSPVEKELEQLAGRDGVIEEKHFFRLVYDLGLPLSQADLQVIVQTLEQSRRTLGATCLTTFADMTSHGGRGGVESFPVMYGGDAESRELMSGLRERIRSWQAKHEKKTLSDLFAEIDSDGNGWISAPEFHAMLARFGYKLSGEDEGTLMRCFDADGDMSVSKDEFFDFVWMIPRSAQLWNIGTELRHRLASRSVRTSELREQFAKVDAKARAGKLSGAISATAFQRIMKKADPDLPSEDMVELLQAFDARHSLDGVAEDVGESGDDYDYGEDRRQKGSRISLQSGWLNMGREPDVRIAWMRFISWMEAGRGDKVLAKIRRMLRRNSDRTTIMREFLRDAEQFVSKKEVGQLLAMLAVTLSVTQFAALWHELDHEGTGDVDKETIIEAFGSPDEDVADTRGFSDSDSGSEVGPKHYPGKRSSRRTGRHARMNLHGDSTFNVDELVAKLRVALNASIDAIWTHYDKDRSGELDQQELGHLCETMLRAANPDLEPTVEQIEEAKHEVLSYRSKGNRRLRQRRAETTGTVDFDTLKDGLLSYLEERYRQQLLGNERSSQFELPDLINSIAYLDRNGDGHIPFADFSFYFASKRRLMSSREANALAQYLDTNHDGSVAVEEFIALLRVNENAAAVATMSPLVKSAVMKVRIGQMPSPDDYVALTFLQDGIPSSARPSSLARLHALQQHRLVPTIRETHPPPAAVMRPPAADSQASADPPVAFQTVISFVKGEGIPSPKSQAKALLQTEVRAIRAGILYGGQLERSAAQSSHVVGNLFRSMATIPDDDRADVWAFPGDAMDGAQENSLLLRCDLPTLKRKLHLATDPDPAHLWFLVELTMWVRKPKRVRSRDLALDDQWSPDTRPDVAEGSDSDTESQDQHRHRHKHRNRHNRRPRHGRTHGHGNRHERRGRRAAGSRGSDSDSDSDTGSEGRSSSDQDGSKHKRRSRRRSNDAYDDDEGDDVDNEYGTTLNGLHTSGDAVEVSCGWVKIPLKDLCSGKSRLEQYPIMHGNPLGNSTGDPIPLEDYKEFQNGIMMHLGDAMPSTVGKIFSRKCTLTMRVTPASRAHAGLMPSFGLGGYDQISAPHLEEILSCLPRLSLLPMGGRGGSTLALFASYIRAKHIRPAQLDVRQQHFVAVFPKVLADEAVACAMYGMFAARYYKLYNAKRRAEAILPEVTGLATEVAADIWMAASCHRKLVSKEAGKYETEYVGQYDTLKEAGPETSDAARQRTARVADEYRNIIREKIRRRLALRMFDENPEEAVLPENDPLIQARRARSTAETEVNAHVGHVRFVAPFNVRELNEPLGL